MSGAQRAKAIFMDAIERAPQARADFVSAACADDVGLAQRVAQLLRAHEDASRVLGVEALPATSDHDLQAGMAWSGYRLQRELGAGGFGSVWLAEQTQPLVRAVAIKLLKLGMDSREVVARFNAEQQALARMDHPGIARVFDAGVTPALGAGMDSGPPAGRPYFVMECVEGTTITEHCDAQRLGVRERVRLAIEVCRALQHAHQKGVVHRDIKPSNVLVTGASGAWQPKVIDFGIAKAVRGSLTTDSLATGAHQLIGTPGYMSPEQVDADLDIDTRADVYAVGALLYELLTGGPPLALDTRDVVRLAERIRHEVPERASVRLAHANAATGPVHARDVRGDLDWIVLRCLEKDRDRRYESVGLLAADLQRYLDGDLVSAGPPTFAYRARKFTRRHWRSLLVSLVLVGVLIAGVLVSTDQATKARAELVQSTATVAFLEDLLMSIDPAVAGTEDTTLLLGVLERARSRVGDASEGLPAVEANLRRIIGGALYSLGQLDAARTELERTLALRRAAFAEDSLEVHRAAAELAPMMAEAGDFGAAVALLEGAHRGLAQHLGERAEETELALSNLAAILNTSGAIDAAEPLMRQLEASALERLGPDHEDTLRARNNLAVLLNRKGDTDGARERLEAVATVQRRTLGLEHPRTLATLNNLAGVYQELGDYDRAATLLRELLDVKRSLLPAGHPSRIIGMNNLARALHEQGAGAEAATLRAEAIAISTDHHGRASRYTLTLWLGEAMARLEHDDFAAAEAAFDIVLADAPAVFGPTSPQTVAAHANRAEARFAQGHLAQAADDIAAARADVQATYPPDAPLHTTIAARAALIQHAQGETQAARPALQAALSELAPDSSLANEVRAALGP